MPIFATAGEFNRAVIALRTIVQTEGLVGLFAGYRSFLLRDLPFDAIEFFAYEQLKITYSKSLKQRRALNPAETSVIGKHVPGLQHNHMLCLVNLNQIIKLRN